jgi:hypothetical protein
MKFGIMNVFDGAFEFDLLDWRVLVWRSHADISDADFLFVLDASYQFCSVVEQWRLGGDVSRARPLVVVGVAHRESKAEQLLEARLRDFVPSESSAPFLQFVTVHFIAALRQHLGPCSVEQCERRALLGLS